VAVGTITHVPRCPRAHGPVARCTDDDCEECNEKRALVERLSKLDISQIAAYCTSVLDRHLAR
jgi:hypothetical protein